MDRSFVVRVNDSIVSFFTSEDGVRVVVVAGFQLEKLTVTILINSSKERLQLLLSIDAKLTPDFVVIDVDIIDDHWLILVVIFSVATSQGPPLHFELLLSFSLGHVISTQFIIGQVLLSWVFSDVGKQSISLHGAQFSCTNNLSIGDNLVSVLIVCTPDVLFKVERDVFSLPL